MKPQIALAIIVGILLITNVWTYISYSGELDQQKLLVGLQAIDLGGVQARMDFRSGMLRVFEQGAQYGPTSRKQGKMEVWTTNLMAGADENIARRFDSYNIRMRAMLAGKEHADFVLDWQLRTAALRSVKTDAAKQYLRTFVPKLQAAAKQSLENRDIIDQVEMLDPMPLEIHRFKKGNFVLLPYRLKLKGTDRYINCATVAYALDSPEWTAGIFILGQKKGVGIIDEAKDMLAQSVENYRALGEGQNNAGDKGRK
jgi:hypothetical protein